MDWRNTSLSTMAAAYLMRLAFAFGGDGLRDAIIGNLLKRGRGKNSKKK